MFGHSLELGRRAWYRVSGASRRARVENVFHRYKSVLGREMRSRTLAGQRVEARIGAKILNRMAEGAADKAASLERWKSFCRQLPGSDG
jgi:hypothetical protein